MKNTKNRTHFTSGNGFADRPTLSAQDRRVLLNRLAGYMGNGRAEALLFTAPLFGRNS